MSGGFSFPAPPPPPPKASGGGLGTWQYGFREPGRGSGRGRGGRGGDLQSLRGRGRGRGGGLPGPSHHQDRRTPTIGTPIVTKQPAKPTQNHVNYPSVSTPRPAPGHKRKYDALQQSSNSLGLTPGGQDPVYSSSDGEGDEDPEVDEESQYAELGNMLTFEHNGNVLSLNSTADLLAWRNERRKNWPTRARMNERKAERRQIGEERQRLLATAAVTAQTIARLGKPASCNTENERTQAQRKGTPKAETELEKVKRQLRTQGQQVAALQKRVARGQANLDAARAQQVEQDEAELEKHIRELTGEDSGSAESSSVLSESSVVSSDSDGPGKDSIDDEPPEEAPSKPEAPSQSGRPTMICKYFAASGYCRDEEACSLRHELAPGAVISQQQPPIYDPMAPKLDPPTEVDRKSISQRWLDQQHEEEDRLALQVIKYLGKAGFFRPSEADA